MAREEIKDFRNFIYGANSILNLARVNYNSIRMIPLSEKRTLPDNSMNEHWRSIQFELKSNAHRSKIFIESLVAVEEKEYYKRIVKNDLELIEQWLNEFRVKHIINQENFNRKSFLWFFEFNSVFDEFNSWFKNMVALFENESEATSKIDSKNKIKWLASPSVMGFIFSVLEQNGYIEMPTTHGKPSKSQYSIQLLEHFEIETTKANLEKELNPERQTLSNEKQVKFNIPLWDKIK